MRRYHADEIRKKFKRVTYSHRQYRRDVRDDSDEDNLHSDPEDPGFNEEEPPRQRPKRSGRRKLQSFCRSSWRRLMRLSDFQPKIMLTNLYKAKDLSFELPDLPERRETPIASDEEILVSDAESETNPMCSNSTPQLCPKVRRKRLARDPIPREKDFSDSELDVEVDVVGLSDSEQEFDGEGTPEAKDLDSEPEIIALETESESELASVKSQPKDYEEMSVDDILDTLHSKSEKMELKEEQPLTPIFAMREKLRNFDLEWQKPVPVEVEVDVSVSDDEEEEDIDEDASDVREEEEKEENHPQDNKNFLKIHESCFVSLHRLDCQEVPEDAPFVIDLT
eukprot:TCALIF_04604-PA protein Name:"Protein of unknown function" AED:0.01 eAED:0.01 QI:339/0.5/0.66/1/0.5/0.66/3/212/336